MLSHSRRRVAMLLLAVLCMGLANPALAIDDYSNMSGPPPSASAMAVDALLVRPLSLVATVLGTGLFIVTLPFSAGGSNISKANQRFIVEPAKYTFQRPLGNFQAASPAGE